MKKEPMTKAERDALKAKLMARTKAKLEAVWNAPGFREEHEAWLREYDAEVAMAEARRRANITTTELARRMKSTRMNVRRIENGQNITLATMDAVSTTGCGYSHLRVLAARSPLWRRDGRGSADLRRRSR